MTHGLAAIVRDARLAVRGLRRTPAFTLATILSIALGMTLAIVTTSVVNAYLIKSLPYPDAGRLYNVMYAPPGPWEPAGLAEFDWRTVADVIATPIAARDDPFTSHDGGASSAWRALRIRPGFIDGLGLSVIAGRAFGPADFAPGAPPAALISERMWREQFAFARFPADRPMELHGEFDSKPADRLSVPIVGVIRDAFFSGRDRLTAVDMLIAEPDAMRAYLVRLRDGVTPAQAEHRLTDAVRASTTGPLPADWPGVRLESAIDRYVGALRPALIGVTIGVVLMLLIVCANVGVLMLLRSMQRQRELAVRVALGSTAFDLARLLVVESTILVGAGAAIGLAASLSLLRALTPSIEMQLGRASPRAEGFGVDATVISVTAAICAAIVLVIALLPLAGWSRALVSSLRHDWRVATDGRTAQRLRHTLIGFEVAGSLVLLIGCGLLLRSVGRMMTTDLGFDAAGLVHARVMLENGKYADGAAAARVHEDIAARVSAATGSNVAFSTWPPFVKAPERRIEADAAAVNAGMISVSPDYFALFRIPIREGAEFTRADLASDAAVAIVSQSLATRLWPSRTAVGQRVRLIDETSNGAVADRWRTVVGVAADVRQGYDDSNAADFYRPMIPDGRYGTFYLRTDRAIGPLFQDLKSIAATVDPGVVVSPPVDVGDDDRALVAARVLSTLLTGFASIACVLAMIGIYGVTAYAVAQRRKEIAIRAALGASARRIVGGFVRRGLRVLFAGSVVGVIGGALLSRALANQVFGVNRFDPFISVLAAVLLIAVGLLSIWVAARRAALVEPSQALSA